MQHLPQAYNNVGSMETFGMYLNAAQQAMADAAEAEANEKAARKSATLAKVAQQNAHSSQMHFNEGMLIKRWQDELAQEVAYEAGADERRMTHLRQEIDRCAEKTRLLRDELYVLANKERVLQQKKVQDEIDNKRDMAREVRQQERQTQIEAKKRERVDARKHEQQGKKLTTADRRGMFRKRAMGGMQPNNNSDDEQVSVG